MVTNKLLSNDESHTSKKEKKRKTEEKEKRLGATTSL
jgi:hypothetical protein